MTKYIYKGPVLVFDKCVADNFTATTYAESEKKALSNISYQFKKKYGATPNSKVTLPGKIIAG